MNKTNRSLKQMVGQSRFLNDLLSVVATKDMLDKQLCILWTRRRPNTYIVELLLSNQDFVGYRVQLRATVDGGRFILEDRLGFEIALRVYALDIGIALELIRHVAQRTIQVKNQQALPCLS